MKATKKSVKVAVIFLCILIIISVFAGCEKNNGQEESSSDQGQAFIKEKIDSVYVAELNRSRELVCISEGKSYTSTGEYKENEEGILTDGIFAESEKEAAGWAVYSLAENKEVSITVDLGEKTEDICTFRVNMLQIIRETVFSADEIRVFISDDGNEFTEIGLMNRITLDSGTPSKVFELSLSGGVAASHIRFSVHSDKTGYAYIDEVSVFAYGDNKIEDILMEYSPLYDGKLPEEVTEPVFWDESEEDYNTEQNLVLGRTPEVFSMKADVSEGDGNSPKSDIYKITDGEYAKSNSYSDPALFRSASAISNTDGRLFIFDLEKTSAIMGFKISFPVFTTAAVMLPDSFLVYSSENGTVWDVIYRRDGIRDGNEQNGTFITLEDMFDTKYRSRFVAVFFDVEGHTRFDEIEIFGTKSAEGATPVSEKGNTRFFTGRFPVPEDANGISDALLMYHAYVSTLDNPEQILNFNEEQCLSVLGYHDREGNITDTYFDTFIFLGGGQTTEWSKADYWRKYFDRLFEEEKNLDALNSAAVKVRDTLGIENFKARVILTLFLPSESFTEFGDIDGDGIDEDLSRLEDKKKVMDWQIEEYIARFNAAGYSNLELAGFYWHDEVVRYKDLHLPAAIRHTTDKAHESGDYIMMACPYYHASGFYDWHNLGFDLVILQPSYYFWNHNDTAIPQTVAMARSIGYGVEMEVEPNAVTELDYLQRYIAYLKGGVDYGYMNACHMYYYSQPYFKSCTANTLLGRQLYELNYRFVKGTLAFTTSEEVSDEVFEGKKGESTSKKLGIEGISTTLSYSTRYGSLKFNTDGRFTYTPYGDFVGEDSFYVEVMVTGADRVIYEVKINITD